MNIKPSTLPLTTLPVARALKGVVLAGLVAASTGCMTDGQMQRLDARFEAGWRPSKGECAFGGATPTLDAYCARVNFGADGMVAILRNENAQVLAAAAGQDLRCTDHVARVEARLKPYADAYDLRELYSCDRDAPVEDGRRVCHVSLLVKDKVTGSRFVVDNGHVLNPATTGGVAPYRDFVGSVDYAWTDQPPAWILLGAQ